MHAGSLDSNGQLTSVSKNVTAQLRFKTAAATQGDIHRAMQLEPALCRYALSKQLQYIGPQR